MSIKNSLHISVTLFRRTNNWFQFIILCFCMLIAEFSVSYITIIQLSDKNGLDFLSVTLQHALNLFLIVINIAMLISAITLFAIHLRDRQKQISLLKSVGYSHMQIAAICFIEFMLQTLCSFVTASAISLLGVAALLAKLSIESTLHIPIWINCVLITMLVVLTLCICLFLWNVLYAKLAKPLYMNKP